MNTDTVSLFSATRRSRSLGLVVAGVIFALVGVGGSGAIARSFVTAGTFAAVTERVAQQPA